MEFDINKALAGHPVRTKNGKEVTSLALYPTAKNYQVAGVVDGELHIWKVNGCFTSSGRESGYDLEMATTKRTVWGVVDSSGFLIGSWPYKPLAADIARIGAGHKVVEVTYEA